jgi:hypothetical protein
MIVNTDLPTTAREDNNCGKIHSVELGADHYEHAIIQGVKKG